MDQNNHLEKSAFYKFSYGLFLLTARDGERDNGCIINTAQQLTSSPSRLTIAVNRDNFTHDMILATGHFNLSVLTQETPFEIFEHFGFQSGRDTDKFSQRNDPRSANGLYYLPQFSNAMISARVISATQYGTHTLFIAEATEARTLSDVPSATYEYYLKHIKPAPPVSSDVKKGYRCRICGYVYEGDPLPADFICPLCKHGAEDFEPIT